jgi:hypothetical protein
VKIAIDIPNKHKGKIKECLVISKNELSIANPENSNMCNLYPYLSLIYPNTGLNIAVNTNGIHKKSPTCSCLTMRDVNGSFNLSLKKKLMKIPFFEKKVAGHKVKRRK